MSVDSVMELYTRTSYQLAEQLTKKYSTSFSLSSRFFPTTIRNDIYAIYGMARIADEIVDTRQGTDASALLDAFENEVLSQIKSASPFSTNPIVHAFAVTAQQSGIDTSLIEPFFKSMRTDISEKTFTQQAYEEYIYGSAEVIGLMCLKVFVQNDASAYESYSNSARALSKAYQKTNFLRDISDDFHTRHRYYFPIGSFESFNSDHKKAIEADIRTDFEAAKAGMDRLPPTSRKAVALSYAYYFALFEKLSEASVTHIKTKRVRLPSLHKTQILAKHLFNTAGRSA